MSNPAESADRPVAVAIPCHNEAAAIADLVRRWRDALPGAEVVVFDNASTDDTASLAREAGARVEVVPVLGKGHAVRAIFERLSDRPAVVMTDGDGTYPPEDVHPLLALVRSGEADMAVGARRAMADDAGGAAAFSPVRALGNRLLGLAFRHLAGIRLRDPLSGYRVFGPRMLAEFRPRATGFEIETELSGAAQAHGYRVREVEVPYHPRTAGTRSKLSPLRDGLRILGAILRIAMRLHPSRVFGLALLALVLLGLAGWAAFGR